MEYLLLCFIISIPWFVIFIYRPDLRIILVFIGLIFAPIGPFSEFWYLADYWTRNTVFGHPVGIEDILFSFFVSGLSFSIFIFLHKKKIGCTSRNSRCKQLLIPITFAFITIVSMIIFTNILGVNSIFTSSVVFLIFFFSISLLRSDLFLMGAASGVYMALILFFSYECLEYLSPGTLYSWCLQCNPTGVRIWHVNIEEIIWDFSWGALGGIMYEAIVGCKLEKANEK